MKILFLGSPAVAVPFLEECVKLGDHSVEAVVTRQDRPSGRGLLLKPPPVKEAALRLGLRVLQPRKPSSAVPELRALAPDLAVVVAYGHIVKPDVLAVPRLGLLNVHFSLLPKYRGAAPVQWSLIRGERRTGVTLFWLDEGMDTGPVQRIAGVDVGPDEDALELFGRLVELGVRELRAALADLSAGRVRREPQAGEPSLAPKLKPEQARIHFGMPADELHNRVRGLRAGPKATLEVVAQGRPAPLRVAVLRTGREESAGKRPPDGPAPEAVPGRILRIEREKGILIQCDPGRLWVREVQPEGKKQYFAADFLNGMRLRAGDRLEAVA
ncbi:MAG: methionyl-tRNA formyltransferase [Elusimicrobiota bacterium]